MAPSGEYVGSFDVLLASAWRRDVDTANSTRHLIGPLLENMTSSTKPEVHNELHRRQWTTELRPQVTYVHKISLSFDVWFLRHASGQTERQT